MPRSIETISTFTSKDLAEAAELTAAGFGRDNDEYNLQDTKDHLFGADVTHFMRDEESLVAFATYRRLVWQPGR